jgi:hypothetical protein
MPCAFKIGHKKMGARAERSFEKPAPSLIEE